MSNAYRSTRRSSGQTRFTSGAATKLGKRARQAYADLFGGVIKKNGDIGFSP